MKKALIILVSLLFVGMAFASIQAQKGAPKVKAAETKTFMGKIETITLGDPTKNTNTEITAVADDGTKLMVTVLAATKFIDTEGKATTIDKIKVGDKIHISYTTTAAGIHEAKSIKLMK